MHIFTSKSWALVVSESNDWYTYDENWQQPDLDWREEEYILAPEQDKRVRNATLTDEC